MTINDRVTAARLARLSTTNVVGTCQLWTREKFNAPSAGDVDHDKDSDAVDGWESEPKSARHADRKPPLGTPCAWSGGSHGNGHRAISLGPDARGIYHIRSTDAGGEGHVATVPLDFPETTWGLHWLGWSDTIDGFLIPLPKKTRGWRIDQAIRRLRHADTSGNRGGPIARALKALLGISTHNAPGGKK